MGAALLSPALAAAQSLLSDIPAQPLSSALVQFANQTGAQLFYNADLVRGINSQGARRTQGRDQALSALLAGSGLNYRVDGDTIVIGSRISEAHGTAASNGATALQTITVVAKDARDIPYETAGSVSHISAEQIERVPSIAVGDIFKSTTGVIAAGNRIGASVDVNIRGLQGQNRVNVMVDGTRQSNHSYRGYRGSRNEVYVDPDLLGGVDISKGPFAGAGGVGAMGGVVNMRTVEAGDIVKPGETSGFRVKGGLGSNTIAPPSPFSYFGSPESTPKSRDAETDYFNGDTWSGSAIAGVVEDSYELVAGVSRRKSGNYFAGTKGRTTYLFQPVNPLIKPRLKHLSPFGPGQEVYNTSQDMTSLLTKGKIRWGDGHALGLSHVYYRNQYGEMDENFLSYAMPPGEWYRAAQSPLSDTRTHTLKSVYEYKPHGNHFIDLTSSLWFSDVESASKVISDFSGGVSPKGQPIKTGIRTYGGDFTNQSVFDTQAGELTTRNGAEFVHETARENGGKNGDGYMGANPNGTRTLASVFNQTKLDVTDWLSVSAGARYDYYETDSTHDSLALFDKKSGSRINPSAGITLEPFDGLQVFATYTEGWRPPSLRETSAIQFNGVSPNPALKPELSRNIELGVNMLHHDVFVGGDTLRMKAAYFDNSHDDYIIRDRYVERRGKEEIWDLKYKWGNIGKAKFKGYEFSASYDAQIVFLEAGLTAYTDVTFCRDVPANLITFVVPTGCGIDRIGYDYGAMNIPPKHSGNVTVGARLLDEKLTIGARGYFFGQRYEGNRVIPGASNIAAYYYSDTIVDLFGSYNVSENAVLNFSVENVGDRYYLDPMSTDIVPSPGRTFRAGLSMRF